MNVLEKSKTKVDFVEILKKSQLLITDEVSEPPICLKIKDSIFGTLGNFSVVSGKAKSRKTFFVSAIVGASIVNGDSYLNISASFPKGKNKIIYIDTEQANFHAKRVLDRIFKIANLPTDVHPDFFSFYTLRQYPTKFRLQIIDYIIKHEKNAGLVIIDGIRDVVKSINDENEATEVSNYLLNWTAEHNLHIITVLHQNKGDENVRGHLGSELENKAESVITVRKLTGQELFSQVESKSMRDQNFNSFNFGIADGNTMYESDNLESSQNKAPKFNEFSDSQYREMITETFGFYPSLQYKDIWQGIKSASGVGDVKAKSIVTHLKDKGFILYDEKTKNYCPKVV
jgi:KaiC/GvpD/RAD55 family RecA-like ATPase